MERTLKILRVVIRALGVLQLVLGGLFWIGTAYNLVPVHMLSGVLIVLILWTLAGMAAWNRASLGLALVGLLWGLVVPALGVTQGALLPGDLHWVVRVVHLLTGLIALGLAEQLARRIEARRASAPAVPAAGVAVAG